MRHNSLPTVVRTEPADATDREITSNVISSRASESGHDGPRAAHEGGRQFGRLPMEAILNSALHSNSPAMVANNYTVEAGKHLRGVYLGSSDPAATAQ